jgi:hypothetical protein
VSDVSKGIFHVNLDNSVEAYCESDSVTIVFNGIVSRNRVIDGKMVVVEINAAETTRRVYIEVGTSEEIK